MNKRDLSSLSKLTFKRRKLLGAIGLAIGLAIAAGIVSDLASSDSAHYY